jgi:hypothetical protein
MYLAKTGDGWQLPPVLVKVSIRVTLLEISLLLPLLDWLRAGRQYPGGVSKPYPYRIG